MLEKTVHRVNGETLIYGIWNDLLTMRNDLQLVTPHVHALFSNPPRRRRYFMKHLTEWHRLYEILVEVKHNIDLDVRLIWLMSHILGNESTQALPHCDILAYLPDIALLWRLSIIREIVLSGFQLDLYLGEEIPFAYWYSAKVIDEHLKCLDNISSTVLQRVFNHFHLINVLILFLHL
jgi:hypothetical protein